MSLFLFRSLYILCFRVRNHFDMRTFWTVCSFNMSGRLLTICLDDSGLGFITGPSNSNSSVNIERCSTISSSRNEPYCNSDENAEVTNLMEHVTRFFFIVVIGFSAFFIFFFSLFSPTRPLLPPSSSPP
jgi:hypothetical protein